MPVPRFRCAVVLVCTGALSLSTLLPASHAGAEAPQLLLDNGKIRGNLGGASSLGKAMLLRAAA